MTPERRLAENLRRMNPVTLWITQGIVRAVDGITCSVEIGDATLEGIRLRASLTDKDRQILVVPKVGSAVTLGSLSGDYNDMVVLQVDEVESITVNGGKLGGLVNIADLTEKINSLVDAFNKHTHTLATGAVQTPGGVNPAPIVVPAIMNKAARLNKADYEDTKITH